MREAGWRGGVRAGLGASRPRDLRLKQVCTRGAKTEARTLAASQKSASVRPASRVQPIAGIRN